MFNSTDAAIEVFIAGPEHPDFTDAMSYLMEFGPADMKQGLRNAMQYALIDCGADIEPLGYDENGRPIYDLASVCIELGVDENEGRNIIAMLEAQHGNTLTEQLTAGSN